MPRKMQTGQAGIKAVPACPGNNIALDASASRRLSSARQSHSPRKKRKLEVPPSVSQQAPATLEGHTPSGSIHQPAHQAEQQRGNPGEPNDDREHVNGEQQVRRHSRICHLQTGSCSRIGSII